MIFPQLEAERMAVISTAHILETDIQLMMDGVFPGKGGEAGSWLSYAGNRDMPVDDDAENEGYSTFFCRLLRLANLNECAYILFDVDGPKIPGIPEVYDGE